MKDPGVVDFTHSLGYSDIPSAVRASARRHLLDLLGVAIAGTRTELTRIIVAHAVSEFGGYPGARLLFDGRRVSATGAALAGGMQIDSVDAHDGHRLTKGHVGCGVLPALLAAAEMRTAEGAPLSEEDALVSLVLGYEIGTRAGIALHQTAADYHTSGAWVAIAAAAVAARILGLDATATREALGIAEYHGPRSPMMRVIDHPTMLKDGSGWGAMAGMSAALLAAAGFTGAPAAIVEGEALATLWSDLGNRWMMCEQYLKPYPVCRWAQPAVSAALTLRSAYGLELTDIESVCIGTFEAAARLDMRRPDTTEQAQYSLPFPVAAALVHGQVGVEQIDGAGLADMRVRALAASIEVHVVADYQARFPAERWSDVSIVLSSGRVLESGATVAEGDPETPLSDAQLEHKFLALGTPALGEYRCSQLLELLRGFGAASSLESLAALIYPATIDEPNRAT